MQYSLDDSGDGQKTIDIDAMATASGTREALGTIYLSAVLRGLGPRSSS
jgi:hypothetical protein